MESDGGGSIAILSVRQAADEEASMTKKPGPANISADEIARVNPAFQFRFPWIFDPAVGGLDGTEFFLGQEKPMQNQMMAVRLEAEANVHKALADAHTKMAGVLKSHG